MSLFGDVLAAPFEIIEDISGGIADVLEDL
jgi:hypothetical protein